MTRIEKTIAFLRQKLQENPYFTTYPEKGVYRLEHPLRVAAIGREIAEKEGFDMEAMSLACLLHDVSYCRPFATPQDWKNHGRDSAEIARPFLEELGLEKNVVGEICYGIAIHVDGKADFPGADSPFALTVGDADNIDRFGVYRIYETLASMDFRKLPMEEQRGHVARTRVRLEAYREIPFATATATGMWRDRIGFWQEFYRRLAVQLGVPNVSQPPSGDEERFLGLAGRF